MTIKDYIKLVLLYVSIICFGPILVYLHKEQPIRIKRYKKRSLQRKVKRYKVKNFKVKDKTTKHDSSDNIKSIRHYNNN